ncbi:hypothetical protein Bbelb_073560 [Branchiostoma belcheri]|nr:hypothetical protein Bbelb_073560 [Branchiostoma belcheri]
MAEDLTSDVVPNVVRNDSFSDSTTEPGTRTVPPTARQTDEDVYNYIFGTCEENEHDDDEHVSIQSGAAFENRETVHISPGDFDTYAIAYTCNTYDTFIKKNVEETKSKLLQGSNTASSNHNENDIHLAGCGSVQSYTDTFNGIDGNMRKQARNPNPMYTHKSVNPYPIHAENKVNPNPMYLQSTSEASNASPGSAFKPNEPYQEIKTVSDSRTQAMDSNPMCTHNTTTPYPLHPENDVNPDRVYTHPQTTIEPSNASPGSAFMSSMPSDDIPCTLTSANTHQQDDANMCQDHLECNAALSDTQPELPSQDLPSAASNDINDVLSNPLSNINGVLNALNPNPLYVPNVQNNAACGCTRRRLCLAAVYTATVLVSCVVIGVFLWLTLSASSTTFGKTTTTSTTTTVYTPTSVPTGGGSSVAAFSKVSNTTRREVAQKWRDDYRCGDGYTTGDGRTAECDPDSTWPCCSPANWCGNTAAHCDCAGCVDYRNTGRTHTESGDRKLENIITIGGNGKEPIVMAYGVAVSADNEIFVTSFKGLQVFSINGNYLRHFPTALPGKNIFIMPYDVAIGIEPGHLWVVGAILETGAHEGHVQVVKYSRSGQAMKKFDVGSTKPSHPSPPVIAIDVRNNKIIVGQGKTVKMFDPDGSLYRSFKVLSGSERGMIGGVTSDSEGNILLTLTHKAIEMYSKSGVKIFEFAGRGKGQMNYGICLDKLGNIIVADNENHRVDMFTSRGKFVRTIANIRDPSGIALGPDGEMVVTSAGLRSTVTIFPRHMVLP